MTLPKEELSRVQAAIVELEGENERAAAVVGAAWLDELLGELIATAFRDDDISRGLLDPLAQGPISSYAARVRVAYALRLIGEENMKDLLQVGRIRNLFAHKVHRRSFDNETVRAPEAIPLSAQGFARDVSNVGHWGVGDVEVTIDSTQRLRDAQPLIRTSFESL